MVEIRRTSNGRRRKIADHFTEQVAKKEALRKRGLRHKDETVWFGLGMFGIVGWAVAIPTLVGIALGLWIDRTWPTRYSWALMLLIAGVMVGCMNAAYWVRKIRGKIIEEDDDDIQQS
ncbi:MAG: ATPase F0F1 [Deltaproteobacteria bacterium HGW-Deltaproteobacteria-13]|jgi:ATP synthase protein I|nr:MAG: ATPase F0F1 [Deltaproteobacteria bacterium HGW-Deltaproteobacteria-13]